MKRIPKPGFKSYHPLYAVWRTMINRCHNPRSKSYRVYGGRGISVCESWQRSFADFLSHMGKRPFPRATIERKNVNGNYEPANCCWATMKEQARNTRFNRLLSLNGRTQCVAAWAEELGIPQDRLLWRKSAGWSDAEALTISKSKYHSLNGREIWTEFNGESKPLIYWADQFKIKRHTLYMRIHVWKWNIERALLTPGRNPCRA